MTDPISILLVETDQRLARLTARYLFGHGVQVTVLRDVRQVHAELLRRRYACIVYDPASADVDEDELCARLGVAIVLLGARADDSLFTEVTRRSSARDLLARIERTLQDVSSEP